MSLVERHRMGWMGEAGGTRSSPTGEAAGRRVPRVEETPPTFDAMFTHYHGPIYCYLLGMAGDAAQAQDLTQDTFRTVYQALPRTPEPALPVWLYRIATNTARAALRQRRRQKWLQWRRWLRGLPRALHLHASAGDTERRAHPAPDPPARCAAEAVGLALGRLSPRQRACLLLRARAGLTVEELAYVLDLSPGAVKRILRHAKERFWAPNDLAR